MTTKQGIKFPLGNNLFLKLRKNKGVLKVYFIKYKTIKCSLRSNRQINVPTHRGVTLDNLQFETLIRLLPKIVKEVNLSFNLEIYDIVSGVENKV